MNFGPDDRDDHDIAHHVCLSFAANVLDGDSEGGRLTINVADLMDDIYAAVRRTLDDDWCPDDFSWKTA